MQPRKSQFFVLKSLAHGLSRHVGSTLANLHPLAARFPGDLDGGAKACVLTALIGEVLGAREHHQINIRIIHQRQNAAVQSRVPDDDDLFHLGIDHIIIRRDLRLAEDMRRRRMYRMVRAWRAWLCDGWHVLEAFYLPGLVPRNDQCVLAQVHGYFAVIHKGRCWLEHAIAGGAGGQGGVDKRGIKGHIDVYLQVCAEALGHRLQISCAGDLGGLRIDAEDALLLDGLGGTRAYQALWPVGANDSQWRMRIVCLHHGRQGIGHGSS